MERRKVCFILHAGGGEVWCRGEWMPVQRSTPSTDNKWAKVSIDEGKGLQAETAQSTLTLILKTGLQWSGQHHLDYCRYSFRVILFPFFDASSWNCGSLCHGYGEGNGTPLQYSCLENPMDGGAWWAAGHGVIRSRTRLSDFTFTFHFHALEKEMATHSSVLAWRIPGKGEPGGLPSLGSHRVGHDWSDLAAAACHGYSLVIM